MLIAIWDWLFTRRRWEVVTVTKLHDSVGTWVYDEYVLRGQFGNLKKKRI